jgi:hypothetical protein
MRLAIFCIRGWKVRQKQEAVIAAYLEELEVIGFNDRFRGRAVLCKDRPGAPGRKQMFEIVEP